MISLKIEFSKGGFFVEGESFKTGGPTGKFRLGVAFFKGFTADVETPHISRYSLFPESAEGNHKEQRPSVVFASGKITPFAVP